MPDQLGRNKEQEKVLKAINEEYKKLSKENRKIMSLQQQLTDSLVTQNRLSAKQLDKMKALAEAAVDRLKENERQNSEEKVTLQNIEEELAKRNEVNKALGLGGSLIKSLAGAMGDFGKALGLQQAVAEMEEFAFNSVDAGTAAGKLSTILVGLKSIAGSVFDNISDPTVIFGAIVKSFTDLESAEQEFRRQTGQTLESLGGWNTELVTSVEYMRGATMLSKQLGVNASNIFSPEDITAAAALTENMGLAEEAAAGLTHMAHKMGKPLSDVKEGMAAAANSFVRSNHTSINLADIMEEVGQASYAIQISMGGSVDKIQEAAMQAHKLGVTLEQVDQIASSLLDFETSIANEMEAELLTGKQLNLEKARQAALMNDLATVATEIANQEGIMLAFATGNRVAQEAAAKAIGLSREEMAKMVFQQNLVKLGSVSAAAAASDMSIKEAERLVTSDKISKSVAKISQDFSKMLLPVAKLLENTFVLKTVMISIGAIIATKIIKGFISAGKEVASLGKGVLKMGAKLTGLGGGGGVSDKITGTIAKVSKGTKGITPAAGAGVQAFFTSLGAGLASFGAAITPVLVPLTVGLALITGAIIGIGFAMKLAAPAFATFGGIITSIFAGVATVITAVAAGFVTMLGALNMENIGPLLLLGPALLGISAGLAAMAVTGIMALPAIAGLVGLSLVAAPLLQLGSMFGGGEGGETEGGSSGNSKIIDKLDELIDLVAAGGDVILDGNKVGRNLAMASSRIG